MANFEVLQNHEKNDLLHCEAHWVDAIVKKGTGPCRASLEHSFGMQHATIEPFIQGTSLANFFGFPPLTH